MFSAVYTDIRTEMGSLLEKKNPALYGGFNWKIENEALKELFEEAIDAVGGDDGPEVIDLTNEAFTVAGEDLGKYVFRTDLQIIVLDIDDSNGVFNGAFIIQTHGAGGDYRYVETGEEGLEVYEMDPVFPKYEYRLSGEDLEGCTVTLSSKNRF